MPERLIKSLGRQMERRRFLMGAGAGALGLVAGLVGVSNASAIVSVACCNLCNAPTSCTNCACVWCWSCIDAMGCGWSCCECHSSDADCGKNCNSVPRSCAHKVGC